MTGIVESFAISAAFSLINAGISYVFSPTQKIQGERLQDLTTSKSNYGTPLPWCWGTVRVGGNLIWTTFKEETSQVEKVGKGAKVENESFSYFGNFAHAFAYCPFRPVVDIPRIWANKELVYSKVGTAATIAEGGVFADRYLRFYYGDQFQDIDPAIAYLEPISNYSYGIPAGKAARDAYLTNLGIDPLTAILTPGYNKRCYIVAQRLPLEDFFNRIPGLEAELVASQNCTVGQIVGDLMSLFFEPNRYDVSLLTEPVDGFFVNSVEAAKNAIQSLQQAYFFDIVQSGNVIKFIPLNYNRSVINLDVNDLAAHQGESEKPLDYEITEEDLTSLPSEVQVTYIDKDLNYDQNEQTSSLEVKTNDNPNIVTLNLNIVMSASCAATLADRAMFVAWLQRRKYSFSLPPAYLDLEPADLVTNVFDNTSYPIKLTQVRHGADFTCQCEGVAYDPSFFNYKRNIITGSVTIGVADYTVTITANGTPTGITDDQGNVYTEGADYTVSGNNVTIVAGGGIAEGTNIFVSTDQAPTPDNTDIGSIPSPGDTDLIVLDIPLIKDTDVDHTVYIAAKGGSDWSGASLYFSTDNLSYSYAADITTFSICGETIGTLGSTGGVSVVINGAYLESITDTLLEAGQNLALIGDEILQYKYAQITDFNTFELTELTRGLRGTECFINNHLANERFVLLQGSGAYLTKVIADVVDMGQIRYFKAPSSGQTLATLTPQSLSYQGISMRPYAPVNLTANKNSVGDITIYWDRRDRHAEFNINNPPLSETTEDYQIQIIDPVNNTVTRTDTSNISSYLYLRTDQITDFGSIQPTITVKIAQVSSIFGVGSDTKSIELTPVELEPVPIISSFIPGSGVIGDTIEVKGSNLAQLTSIAIGGVDQLNLSVADNNTAFFTIAPESVSNFVELTTDGGVTTSKCPFVIETGCSRHVEFNTSRALNITDSNKILNCESNSQLTISLDKNLVYPGFETTIRKKGDGDVFLSLIDTSDILESVGNKIKVKYSAAYLSYQGNGIWISLGSFG